jgi:uncharacterized protein (DUF2141 family)
MKNITLVILFVLSLFSTANAQDAETVTLKVQVEGTISDKGSIVLNVYNSKGSWLSKEFSSLKIDVTQDDSRTFVIEGLPAGEYAISVMHDVNNNNELDMGQMGPEESYGFSNGARGQYGPPPFEDAAITVDSDKTITVQIF